MHPRISLEEPVEAEREYCIAGDHFTIGRCGEHGRRDTR